MKPPATVTLHVPYADNERQFLLQAVEIAMKAFRNLNGNPVNYCDDISSASTDRNIAVSPHFLESLPHRTIEFDS